MKKVTGERKEHKIYLYALTTCGWCRKTKKLLDDNKLEYEYIYVDELSGAEKNKIIEEMKMLNPRLSFPTIKIDSEIVIGFDEERLQKLLGLK